MAQIKTSNGAPVLDETRQPIYDTIEQAGSESPNSPAQRDFFSSVAGKAKWQCNLRQNNMLDGKQSYRALGLQLYAQTLTAADRAVLIHMQRFSSLRFNVGVKDYWEGPVMFLTGGVREQGYAAIGSGSVAIGGATNSVTTAATTVEKLYQAYGKLDTQPIDFGGSHAVEIEPNESFIAPMTSAVPSGLVSAATPTVAIQYTLKLIGFLRRPVQ